MFPVKVGYCVHYKNVVGVVGGYSMYVVMRYTVDATSRDAWVCWHAAQPSGTLGKITTSQLVSGTLFGI